MKNKCLKRLFFLVLLGMAFNEVAFGQRNDINQNSPLVQRFERAIKTKEKKFSHRNIVKSERRNDVVSSAMVWRLGEAGIEVNFYEFDTVQAAIDFLNSNYLNSPLDMARHGRSKLTNLGDESYITPSMFNQKRKTVSMLVRKGSVLITISASDAILGKRFAKYFVREIEKRDRGEP